MMTLQWLPHLGPNEQQKMQILQLHRDLESVVQSDRPTRGSAVAWRFPRFRNARRGETGYLGALETARCLRRVRETVHDCGRPAAQMTPERRRRLPMIRLTMSCSCARRPS